MKHYVIIKYCENHPLCNKKGTDIWASYDDEYVWDSPIYEVLGYAASYEKAKEIKVAAA